MLLRDRAVSSSKHSTASRDLARAEHRPARNYCFRLPRLLASPRTASVRAGCQQVWPCPSSSRKNTTEMCNSFLEFHLVCHQTEAAPTTCGPVSHCFQISGGSQANEDLGKESQSSGVQKNVKQFPIRAFQTYLGWFA